MKKTVIFPICLALFLSCDSLLEEHPKGTIPQGDFFATTNDAEQATYAIYKVFADVGLYARYWQVIDVGTDDVGTADGPNGRQEFAGFSLAGHQDWFGSTNPRRPWDQWWRGINRANYVIDGLVNLAKAGVDPDVISAIRGEAMFLRAFCYFNIVRGWGDAPIITWFVENTNYKYTSGLNREKVSDVYDRIIIPDLVYASEYAPDNQVMRGRATRWLARTLLAEAYATRAGYWRDSQTGEIRQGDPVNWSLARQAAWSVIMPGSGCPFYLLTDGTGYSNAYARNWERDFGDEAMLEIGSFPETDLGSWLTRECFTNIMGGPFWGGVNAQPFAPGNMSTVQEMRFIGAANVGWFAPQPSLAHAMEPGDLRLWGICIKYDDPASGKTYLCQPAFCKYIDFQVAMGMQGTSFQYAKRNFIVYRYADALLLFAEADNEVNGPTPEGIEAVNAIRNRAGLGDLDAAKTANKEVFRLAIKQERRIEFHAECKRRFDLIRWGELTSATTDYDRIWLPSDNPKPGGGSYFANNLIGVSFTYVLPQPAPGAATVTQAPPLFWLLPIPSHERNQNQHWYDNHGY